MGVEEEDVSKEELEERVRQMEGEQEELAGSLQALTSHYARLQLRLQQVQKSTEQYIVYGTVQCVTVQYTLDVYRLKPHTTTGVQCSAVKREREQ